MTHSTRATAALRALTECDPALAALSLWCAHRDDAGPTRTIGTEIRYGPGFATLPLHEQIGLAGHHILHAALQHGARMAAMEARFPDHFAPDLWQIAADAIVNEVLLHAGHALPRPALTLTGLLGDLTGGAVPVEQALAEWDADRLYLRLQADQAGGEAGRARAYAAAHGFAPDLEPTPADPQADETQADWRAHLSRAMAAGLAAGQGLGTFGHRLADLPQPRTPWEVTLRRLLARATLAQAQPSHSRPARGWLALDAQARRAGGPSPVFQPGLARRRDVPRILCGLDCSTSIDGPRLALFMAEIASIARRTGGEVHLAAFDTAIRLTHRLDPHRATAELQALDLPQGGGTDFAPLLAHAARMRPSALVVLTDLDAPFGPNPRCPVIWAVPLGTTAPAPPFGRVLSLRH